jgi:hypothetical protein
MQWIVGDMRAATHQTDDRDDEKSSGEWSHKYSLEFIPISESTAMVR